MDKELIFGQIVPAMKDIGYTTKDMELVDISIKTVLFTLDTGKRASTRAKVC